MKYDKIKIVSFRAESRLAGRSREILLDKEDFFASGWCPSGQLCRTGSSFTSVACLLQAGNDNHNKYSV
jgi:hypothetical protein